MGVDVFQTRMTMCVKQKEGTHCLSSASMERSTVHGAAPASPAHIEDWNISIVNICHRHG